jgi:polynucleotide 5'-hydroxyl-kinase GRC3/NOL9
LNRILEKGKTLLVDGPASLSVISGKVEVFGFLISDARRIVIREGKRLPFAAQETASVDLELGAGAELNETEGNTVPQSWAEAYKEIRQISTVPAFAVVVGGTDSGKSSFCTYLINRFVEEKRKVAILDEDLGQSDIGPPATVAYALVSKPTTDLFCLKPENTIFVGATSPIGVTNKTIEATARLKMEILAKATADCVVVNTDG